MITSVSNPQMKRIKELLNKSKQRRKEKCFVAEGIRMVAETPADRLERVYVSESFYRHPPELRGLDLSKALIVDDQVFRQVSDTQTPQGIMAVVRQQENSLDAIMKQPDALLLFLENIQDPGNLGTMMRTAEPRLFRLSEKLRSITSVVSFSGVYFSSFSLVSSLLI